VGAVAVLFLFVVMMLDVDFTRLRQGFQRYAPLGAVVGGILFLELVLVLGTWQFAQDSAGLRLNPMPAGVDNTRALGRSLYDGPRLAVPDGGADPAGGDDRRHRLTLRGKTSTKRQDIAAQVARSGSVNLRQPAAGAGLGQIGIERPPVEAPPRARPKQVEHHGANGGHH
jgi:NADH-quinone oxidoreductase subunit J